MMIKIKQQLYDYCVALVAEKLTTIQRTIADNKKGLESETKSSAGDKHETGRAMLQLEMEKAGQQLKEVTAMQIVLSKTEPEIQKQNIRLGSLVQTNLASYYIAISAGRITIGNENYYAVSTNSPIGEFLLGKQIGDTIYFNNKRIQVEDIF